MKIKLKNITQIKTLLRQKGYSQRKFAKAIGVHEAYLQKILTGVSVGPGPILAARMASILGVTFDDIFCIIEAEKHLINTKGEKKNETS